MVRNHFEMRRFNARKGEIAFHKGEATGLRFFQAGNWLGFNSCDERGLTGEIVMPTALASATRVREVRAKIFGAAFGG